MRAMKINGIPIHIINSDEKEQRHLSRLIPLGWGGTGNLFIASQLTRKDLIIATGHDYHKIDFAVPRDWWEAKGRPDVVWSYEDNGTFGEPLYIRDLFSELRDLVLATLVTE